MLIAPPKPNQHYTELLRVLVQRNLNVRYRGSLLGVYWSLLSPLIMTGLYTAIFGSAFAKYYNSSIFNYSLAVLTGMLLIHFFSTSTGETLSSVVRSGPLLNKIKLPISVFPISTIIAHVCHFMIASYPALLLVTLWNSHNLLYGLAILLPFLALVLFCLGVGLFTSALFVFFRDLPYLYEILVFILWMSSPVFYPATIVPEQIRPLLRFNPLYPIIESMRQITIYNQLPDLTLILQAIVSGGILTLLSWVFFQKTKKYFIDLV
ncbi:MAG: ABC transporter permease [Pseudanabaenaceae cyanobacterium]